MKVKYNITLIGFKNAGKSSVAKIIAAKTNREFIDTDRLIEEIYYIKENKSATTREIYKTYGESYFRSLEKECIKNLDNNRKLIIATGGGAILNADNITNLKKNSKLIYLSAASDVLLERLQKTPSPAFIKTHNLKEEFYAIYQQRENLYKSAADMQINTNNKSIDNIAAEIIKIIDKIY